jgi:DNA-binding CsgD family transcriptional regulator
VNRPQPTVTIDASAPTMKEFHLQNKKQSRETVIKKELNEKCLSLGFDHASFTINGLPDDTYFSTSTYPDAWEEEYQRNQYFHQDPTIHLAMQSPAPLDWSVAENFDHIGLFEKFRAAGLGNCGISIPVEGGYGEKAILSVTKKCSSRLWCELIDANLPELESMTIDLHRRALVSWKISTEVGIKAPTKRQAQILQMVAAGKNAKYIAGSLQLSQKTVENHLKDVRHNLKAMNSQQAVARAIGLGFIFPA